MKNKNIFSEMKTAHRYILQPYKGMKTKHRCPNCEQNKKFTLYIDTETNESLNDKVGRCDRSDNCGYHYTPKQYFSDNNHLPGTPLQVFNFKPKAYVIPKQIIPSFIPVEVFKASLKGHETNHFVQFLIHLFGVEIASELVSRYFIATSKHWNGATVFWQIDTQGKVRTGKIMLYNPTTGKRVKNLELPVYWVHKALKQPEFELRQCLFGEHLLKDKTKPIAIVESEKTAVIASVYLPQFIWVAVGSLTNLNAEKCSILKGRTVKLFPDLNGFEKWSKKAQELSHIALFTVSDLLERKASETEKKQGFDIADYLIQFDFNQFNTPEIPLQQKSVPLNLDEVNAGLQTENLIKPEIENQQKRLANVSILKTWEDDVNALERFFSGTKLPDYPVKLNPCCTISDVLLFIDSHLSTVKANKGNPTFTPYLTRLQELKQFIDKNQN